MFENIVKFFKNLGKKGKNKESSDTAKERLHLVLMQDRANVSADFLELMKQEIIEVIKKYIDIDEKAIDVRLTNKTNEDGTVGAPALYANIPIVTIKNEARVANVPHEKENAEKTDVAKTGNSEDKQDNKNKQPEKVIEEAKKIQNEVEKEINSKEGENVEETTDKKEEGKKQEESETLKEEKVEEQEKNETLNEEKAKEPEKSETSNEAKNEESEEDKVLNEEKDEKSEKNEALNSENEEGEGIEKPKEEQNITENA